MWQTVGLKVPKKIEYIAKKKELDKPKKRRVIKFTCILACAVAYL